MDLTHIVLAALSAVLNVASWVLPSDSPWHAIAMGAVAVVGGMSALVAGHQHASTPQFASSSHALSVGGTTPQADDTGGAQVLQLPPEQDQQGLP
jgi:hypothetical protein